MIGRFNAVTQAIDVTVLRELWTRLPSNMVEFDELTLEEEGALRSLLADIWLTPDIDNIVYEERGQR